MRDFIVSHGRRFAALITVLGVSAITLAFSNAEKIESDPVINPDEYDFLMSYKVGDIYDLEQYFVLHQYNFLPITPPPADFILQQSGMPDVLPFDAKSFPSEFVSGLVGTYEYSALVYPLVVLEDPNTREIVFLNSEGKEIYTLPPAPGYDPYAYLKSRWSALYSGKASLQAVNYWQGIYDPARVQLRTKLIPTENVEPYLYAQAKVAETAAMMQEEDEGGGGMMMLMEGESDSNIVFTAIYKTNSVAVTIAYPEDFTNRLDIFTGNDLLPEIWSFAVRELPTTGTNQITWTDTNSWIQTGLPVRFYAAGNADLDTDGDGYADAREIMVYKTDYEDIDSHPVKVSGTVSYSGIETGTIFVVWVTESNSWSIAKSITLPGPAAYTNEEVGNDESYWIKAFRDVNENNTLDAWEPTGLYSNNSILITGDIAGVNITMTDVPSIWGTIDYTGSETGDIYVIAVTSSNSWDTTYKTVIPWSQGETNELGGGTFYVSFPVEYTITGLPTSNYFIRAFIDSDTNTIFSLGEAAGQYASNGIPVSNRVTGIDFTLDLDSDGDEMPDWWEWQYGFDPFDEGNMRLDRDGDDAENYKEFLFGANPDNPDTDSDGMPDGWEILYGFAPLNSADASSDPDNDGLNNLNEYLRGTYPNNPDCDGDLISDGSLDPDGSGPIIAGPDPNPLVKATGAIPGFLTSTNDRVIAMSKDVNGRPILACKSADSQGKQQLYVLGWFGKTSGVFGEWENLDGMWESFGHSAAGSGVTEATNGVLDFDLAVDTNGMPAICWTEQRSSNNWGLYYRAWTGTNWTEMGGSHSNGISKLSTNKFFSSSLSYLSGSTTLKYAMTGSYVECSLAFDVSNRAYVAYKRWITGNESSIQLKKFDGNTWIALGSSTNLSGLSGQSTNFFPKVAVGSDGIPMVSYWTREVGPGNDRFGSIYVRKWNSLSNTWDLLGSRVDSAQLSSEVYDFNVTTNNIPQVAWQQLRFWHTNAQPQFGLYFRQFSGGAWTGYGSSDVGIGLGKTNTGTIVVKSCSILSQSDGQAGLAWLQSAETSVDGLYVRSGTNWSAMGSSFTNAGVNTLDKQLTHLASTASGGSAVVAYGEHGGANSFILRVKEFQGDSDGDGLSDVYEQSLGLNPNSNDTDGDGVSDWDEIFLYGTDALSDDSDSDNLTDGEEVNGTKWGVWSDPLNPDTDGDGIQDDCDPFPNSLAGDNDGDGIPDELDPDDDNDGWSDSYETGTSGTDPLNPDTDCDGIPDSLDTGGADTTPPVITIIEPVEGALP